MREQTVIKRILSGSPTLLLAAFTAASPAHAQLGPVPLAGQAVQATGAPAARPLANKLSDQLSVLDFGAACDGRTDDSAAITAAGTSGRRVVVPSGVTCNAPGVVQSAMQGVFIGGGQIRGSDGNPRGPQFAAVRIAPNPQAWNQASSSQDNCSGGFPCWAEFDYSHTLSAEEFHVSGPATLGRPLHGYEGMPGTNAHQLFMDNNSGWNQSHNSNDGRTGVGAYSVVLQTNGAGDTGVYGAQLLCNGQVGPGDGNTTPGPNGIINGYTDWLAVPNCGFQGGNISALAPGQYLQMQEFHLSDYGNDVSAIGTVMGYNRTATTAKINNRWVDQLTTCNLLRGTGSVPCDAAHVIGGQWYIGLDFVGLPNIQSITAPIAMMANQKITLNGSNNDGEGNPALTNLGGDWIMDDGAAIVLAQNGNSTVRVYSPQSAVNGWQFTGSTTGNAVTVGATGSDTAIPVLVSDKGGAGVVTLSNGSVALRVASAAGSSGYLNVSAGTATAPLLLQDYSLANQDIGLGAAGTGLVRLVGAVPGNTDASTAVATTAFTQAAVKAAVTGMIGNRYKILAVGTGATITVPVPAGVVDQMIVEIEPNAATIASMALTMPTSASIPDGFIVHFICTGTITSFAVAGNTSQAVLGGPGSITPTTPAAFMWDGALAEWIAFR